MIPMTLYLLCGMVWVFLIVLLFCGLMNGLEAWVYDWREQQERKRAARRAARRAPQPPVSRRTKILWTLLGGIYLLLLITVILL